jgi:hypothetical protein
LSQQTEVSLYHSDEKIKQEASDYVSLMTPVVKSLFTDLAMEITSDAMQIHGGYGFTKDQGIEQLYRDNRITPIYEGTNSVQAADLVFRKLTNKNGDIIGKFLEMIKSECDGKNGKVKTFSEELNYYLDILSKFTDWIKVLDVSYNEYDSNKKFYDDKINTAKFYFEKVLPRAELHYKSAISGSSNIMNFKFN